MDLFKGSRTLKVIMRDFHGGMEAVKETELARKKTITMLFDVPVTTAIKDTLAPWIIQFLNSAGGHADAKGKRAELKDCSFKASITFMRLDDKKVLAECGFEDKGEPCTVNVQKFFFVDADEMMRLKVTTAFREDLWKIGGDYLGDGELYIKTKPHQGNLKLDADMKTEDDDLDAPKKKAKKTLPAEEPEPAQA